MPLLGIERKHRVLGVGFGTKFVEPKPLTVEERHQVYKFDNDYNGFEPHEVALTVVDDNTIVSQCQTPGCPGWPRQNGPISTNNINTDPLTRDRYFWKP